MISDLTYLKTAPCRGISSRTCVTEAYQLEFLFKRVGGALTIATRNPLHKPRRGSAHFTCWCCVVHPCGLPSLSPDRHSQRVALGASGTLGLHSVGGVYQDACAGTQGSEVRLETIKVPPPLLLR